MAIIMFRKFRVRRGKLVEIPFEHIGQFPTSGSLHNRKIAARCKKLDRRKRLMKEKNDHLTSYVCVYDPGTMG